MEVCLLQIAVSRFRGTLLQIDAKVLKTDIEVLQTDVAAFSTAGQRLSPAVLAVGVFLACIDHVERHDIVEQVGQLVEESPLLLFVLLQREYFFKLVEHQQQLFALSVSVKENVAVHVFPQAFAIGRYGRHYGVDVNTAANDGMMYLLYIRLI